MELAQKLWVRIQNREFPEMARELARLQGMRLEDVLKLKGVEDETRRFDGTTIRKIDRPEV